VEVGRRHDHGRGSYVAEITIRADNVKGAGILLQFIQADGSEFPGASVFHELFGKKDTSGWAGNPDGTTPGYLRTFSWFHQTPIDGNIVRCNVYTMANYGTGPGQSVAKAIEWYEFRLRPATEAEVAQHDPINGLGSKASITYADQVGVDAAGNAVAISKADYDAKFGNVAGQISDAIFVAAGPAGIVGQRINAVAARNGNNIVSNAGLVTAAGWFAGGTYTANPADAMAINLAGDDWRFPGENNLSMYQAGGNSAEYMEWYSDLIGTDSGKLWQMIVYSASHRADTQVYVQRFDTSANPVDYIAAARIERGGSQNGGRNPSWWDRDANKINFQALGPIRILLRKWGTNAHLGMADSFAWFSRPQVAEIPDLNMPPLAYSPSSDLAVSKITQIAVNDLKGKLKSSLEFIAEAGPSVARVGLVAVNDNGDSYASIILDAPNVYISGNLIVAKTVKWNAVDTNDLGRYGSGSWSGTAISPAAGTSQQIPFALSLGTIKPSGVFTSVAVIATSSDVGTTTTTTMNGKPYRVTRVSNGTGVSLGIWDNEGHFYGFPIGTNQQPILATGDFSGNVTAVISNGNYDSGIIDDGDSYRRLVSGTVSITSISLQLRWSSI
jgi:hypothetical protein